MMDIPISDSRLRLEAGGLEPDVALANEITIVSGLRGYGKSWFISKLAHEFNLRDIQFFHLDSANANAAMPGVFHVNITAKNYTKKIPIYLQNVVFQNHLPPSEKGGEMWFKFINNLTNHVKKLRKDYTKCIILDEAHHAIPRVGDTPCKATIKHAVTSLRSTGLGWIFATQRLSEMETTVRNEAKTIVVFRMKGATDLRALKEWLDMLGHEDPTVDISQMERGEYTVLG